MEYPRAFEAVVTYTESGEKEWVKEGDTRDALIYELLDMEKPSMEIRNVCFLIIQKMLWI